jgi:6-phosphofructokinase
VSQLITIGGDDTAYSAMKLEERARGTIRVVHVPKTIDNDLDLPSYVDTFGFQTARHHGVEIVKNLMVDAKTTSRWYFVVAMGRKAGHLALGIGKAAGATLTLISEEFDTPIRLKAIVDTLVGAIVKRLSHGRTDGVAVLAEGLVEVVRTSDIEGLEGIERDAHGHIRIAEVDFGNIVKAAVQKRLKELGIKTTIVAKNIGYELRCADPIPFDMDYTRDLGDHGQGHRPHARSHGRHHERPLHDRAQLHAAAQAARLRGQGRDRPPRASGEHEAVGVPRHVLLSHGARSPPALAATDESRSSSSLSARGLTTKEPRN